MKRKSILGAVLAAVAVLSPLSASALDIKDILGAGGGAVSNIVEGIFTRSDIEVKDMKGEWTASGSAVAFQDENFLKKAGGSAAAGAIEAKLNPYYEKYGLTGSTLNIKEDGTFTMKVGKISLNGTIEKSKDKGMFNFNFQAFGKIPVGKIKAYVEKTPTALNVMFDATALKKVIGIVTSISGSKLVSSVGNIIDSYDGLCVGFRYDKVKTEESGSAASEAVNGLLNILKGKK